MVAMVSPTIMMSSASAPSVMMTVTAPTQMTVATFYLGQLHLCHREQPVLRPVGASALRGGSFAKAD